MIEELRPIHAPHAVGRRFEFVANLLDLWLCQAAASAKALWGWHAPAEAAAAAKRCHCGEGFRLLLSQLLWWLLARKHDNMYGYTTVPGYTGILYLNGHGLGLIRVCVREFLIK